MRSGDIEITQLGIYPSKFYTISILRAKKVDDDEEREVGKEEGKDEEAAEEKPKDEGRIIYHLW